MNDKKLDFIGQKGYLFGLEELNNDKSFIQNYKDMLEKRNGVITDGLGNLIVDINDDITGYVSKKELSNLLESPLSQAKYFEKKNKKELKATISEIHGYDRAVSYANETFESEPSIVVFPGYFNNDSSFHKGIAVISTKKDRHFEEAFHVKNRS